jgi:hypothetical protein
MGTSASKTAGTLLKDAAKSAAAKVKGAGATSLDAAASRAMAKNNGPLSTGSMIQSSSQASSASDERKREEYEAIMRRVNQRPASFKKLDQDDSDIGSAPKPADAAAGASESPAEDEDQNLFKTRLPTIDKEAAEVAKEVQKQLSGKQAEPHQTKDSGTDASPPDISVTRLKPSRLLEDIDPEAARAMHVKDTNVLRNLERILGPLPVNGEVPPVKGGGGGSSGKVVSLAELAGEDEPAEASSHSANTAGSALGPAGLIPEILTEKDQRIKIQSAPDYDSPGARSFAIYEAMQLNPKILDTSAAIASSPALLIAAQMAAGIIPPSAQGDRFLSLPAGTTKEDVDGGILIPGGVRAIKQLEDEQSRRKLLSDGKREEEGKKKEDSADDIFSSLVAVDDSSIDALVPAEKGIDQLLLAKEPEIPKGMTKWGPRPPDASAYDQLILHPEEEEFALERGEVFELYARHKADPDYWTAERLADKYDTKPEWVEVLLNYASPPLFVQVDGDAYGVVAIKSYADMHQADAERVRAEKEAKEAADDAAAAATASSDYDESNGKQLR